MFIAAKFLNGLKSSMNTIPMLNICTPPPDMYSMNACMGSDFAGEMAKSHARLSLRDSYDAFAVANALLEGFDCEKPGKNRANAMTLLPCVPG